MSPRRLTPRSRSQAGRRRRRGSTCPAGEADTLFQSSRPGLRQILSAKAFISPTAMARQLEQGGRSSPPRRGRGAYATSSTASGAETEHMPSGRFAAKGAHRAADPMGGGAGAYQPWSAGSHRGGRSDASAAVSLMGHRTTCGAGVFSGPRDPDRACPIGATSSRSLYVVKTDGTAKALGNPVQSGLGSSPAQSSSIAKRPFG